MLNFAKKKKMISDFEAFKNLQTVFKLFISGNGDLNLVVAV